ALTNITNDNLTHIHLCLDSKDAITALHLNSRNHHYAREAIHQAQRLATLGFTITTHWTPAHCGIPGNHEADRLAKNLHTATPTPAPCKHAVITKEWMIRANKDKFHKEWKEATPLVAEPAHGYPHQLRNLSYKDSRALFRT